jgi:hypothetical protein
MFVCPGKFCDLSAPPNDTSHEIGTLEAVNSEILGDYDAYCLYADEPLASQECYARYLKLCGTQATKRDATTKIRRP